MNVVVLDDELEMVNYVGEILNNILSDGNIYLFTNYKELEHDNIFSKIDVLFIDIKLNNVNGIDFVKKYTDKLKKTKIIYITGYDEYIEDVFETNPIYFLKKPLNKNKIEKSLLKVLNEIKNEEKYISVKKLNEIIKIKYSDIFYMESIGRKVNIYTKDGIINSYRKISDIEKELSYDFIRVHKSFIINLKYIKVYQTNKILLDNGDEVSISRSYQKKCRAIIINYLKGGLYE